MAQLQVNRVFNKTVWQSRLPNHERVGYQIPKKRGITQMIAAISMHPSAQPNRNYTTALDSKAGLPDYGLFRAPFRADCQSARFLLIKHTNYFCWNTPYQGLGSHVLDYQRTRPDNRPLPNRHPWQNRAAGANPASISNLDRPGI
jgi:hypothetical protein